MTDHSLTDVRELARQLRVDSIRCSTVAGSGQPTSSMSAADVMAVLLARHFRYDWEHPDKPANDHLIFSKAHASPLLYSMFKAAGVWMSTSGSMIGTSPEARICCPEAEGGGHRSSTMSLHGDEQQMNTLP